MTYTIGIGALIQDDAFNHIRAIELDTAKVTSNYQGLAQPPHVTVKRPFTVEDVASIKKAGQLMHTIASQVNSFELTLNGISNFADKVWYLKVKQNDTLNNLHERCLDALTPLFSGCKGVFEGDKMVFHSTVTMDITPEQFKLAGEYLKSQSGGRYSVTTSITKLGLFLGMNNNTHWVIIDQADLGD